MPFNTGVFRIRSASGAKTWSEKLESAYAADHPRHRGRYHTYLHYVAFLTAGYVEHHWTEGTRTNGEIPFVPRGRSEDFLPDLHKKMRAFRESRYIDGLPSPELARHSYELLEFLEERVPGDKLEQFLGIARGYVTRNENECLAS